MQATDVIVVQPWHALKIWNILYLLSVVNKCAKIIIDDTKIAPVCIKLIDFIFLPFRIYSLFIFLL